MTTQTQEKKAKPESEQGSDLSSEISLDDDFDSLDDLRTEIMGQIEEAKTWYEKQYHITWDEMNNLYRGIRERGKNQLEWQHNYSSGKPFGIVQQVYTHIMQGLYPKEKLWSITPRENDNENNQLAAKAWKEIMLVQSKGMHLRRNMGWSVLDAIIFDCGIMEYGWKFQTITKKYLDWKTGKVEVVGDVERISMPYFESVAPFDMIGDLDAQSWETQGWVGRRIAVSWGEIESDRAYNRKDEKARLQLEFKDKDKLTPGKVFEGWKYTKKDLVVIILDGGYIIKKHTTLLKSNEINYLPIILFPEQRTPIGIGLLSNIKDSLQYFEKVMNSNADNLDLAIQRLWVLKSNSDIPFNKLKVSLGKVWKVGPNDDLQALQMPGINADSYKEMQLHDSIVNTIAGNNEPFAGETATQDKLNAIQTTQKANESVMYNQEEFLIPGLTAWLNMNQQFMTVEECAKVVGKVRAGALRLEDKAVDLNIALDVELSGEASEYERLLEVDNMSQFTNLAVAIAQLPPQLQGPMYEILADLFGYKDKLTASAAQTAPVAGATGNQGAGPDNITPEMISAIKAEAEAFAKAAGVTVDQYMNDLAAKMQLQPQDLIIAIVKAGSIQKLLQGGGK
jgi:hypothetical protein